MQAYVVPSEDPHQSEYAAACYERRQFISRFTARAQTPCARERCADVARAAPRAHRDPPAPWW